MPFFLVTSQKELEICLKTLSYKCVSADVRIAIQKLTFLLKRKYKTIGTMTEHFFGTKKQI
jgi:hypothetical protein